jgi:F0F1-type ATP synthase beta subunit
MIQQTHKILKEFSDLIDVISVGMTDDGKIDRQEATRIRDEWQQMKTIAEGFVLACEKGVYGAK